MTARLSRRLTVIIFTIVLLLSFLLFAISYQRSSKDDKKAFFITIVDYRWDPVKNFTVRLNRAVESFEEIHTNNQGQVVVYLDNNISNADYLEIVGDEFNEKVQLTGEHITIRLRHINQNTGEMYDDDMSIGRYK